MLNDAVICLSEWYVAMDRVEEAIELHKSLCDEIGKESMEPDAILQFAMLLQGQHENSRALTILEDYLEVVERSWGELDQCRAYAILAALYRIKNDFAKSMCISNVNCPPRRRRRMSNLKLQRCMDSEKTTDMLVTMATP